MLITYGTLSCTRVNRIKKKEMEIKIDRRGLNGLTFPNLAIPSDNNNDLFYHIRNIAIKWSTFTIYYYIEYYVDTSIFEYIILL